MRMWCAIANTLLRIRLGPQYPHVAIAPDIFRQQHFHELRWRLFSRALLVQLQEQKVSSPSSVVLAFLSHTLTNSRLQDHAFSCGGKKMQKQSERGETSGWWPPLSNFPTLPHLCIHVKLIHSHQFFPPGKSWYCQVILFYNFSKHTEKPVKIVIKNKISIWAK